MEDQEKMEQDTQRMSDAFDAFITKYGELHGDNSLTVAEYGVILYQSFVRLRQVFYIPELAAYTSKMLILAEGSVQEAMEDEDDPYIGAENWRENPDGEEMMAELNRGFDLDNIPEEWLEEE